MSSTTDLARRDEEASTLIERCGYGAAALAAIPIPLTETVGVTAVHVGMVVGLARIHGVTLTTEHATAMILRIGGTIGVSWIGTRALIGLAKLVLPGLPGLVGAPLVFCSTLGLGAVVGATFAAGEAKEELTDDEVRAIYKDALAGAKARFDPRRVADPAARATAEAVAAQASPPTPVAPTPVAAVPPPPTPRSPFDSAVTPAPATTRPPIDAALSAVKTDRLTRLRRLRDDGVLLDSEYDAACKQLADEA